MTPHRQARRLPRLAVIVALTAGALVTIASPAAARPAPTRSTGPGRPIRWLAVGDSYSAGEGLPDVNEPTCQRADGDGGHTSKAWAVVAREKLGDRLPIAANSHGQRGFDFEACTGAVTEDLFSDGPKTAKKEWDPQNNGRFDLVTFTFGGNNVGFESIVMQCLGFTWNGVAAAAAGAIVDGLSGAIDSWAALVGCPADADMRRAIDGLKTGGNDLKGRHLRPLSEFYQQIASDVVNPGGNVVVLGYPEFVEDPKFWPVINKAMGLCQGIRERDALKLRGMAGYLNQTIGEAVKEANNNPYGVHFTFVDVNTGQPDAGVGYDDQRLFEPSKGDRHNLCAAKQWLNGMTTGLRGGDFRYLRSFHPTQDGHNAEGALLADRIAGLDWSNLSAPTAPTTVPAAPYRFPYDTYNVPQLGPDPARGSGCGLTTPIGDTYPDGVWVGMVKELTTDHVVLDGFCVFYGAKGAEICAQLPPVTLGYDCDPNNVTDPTLPNVERTIPLAPNFAWRIAQFTNPGGSGNECVDPGPSQTLDPATNRSYTYTDGWVVIRDGQAILVLTDCLAG